MKYEKDRKIFGIDEYLIIKFLKKYALPLIAGLLVLIILISDMPKRLRKNKESEPAAVTQAENSGSGEGAAAETTREPVDYANAVPASSGNTELNDFIDSFLNAKVNGDADAMYRIFGRTDDTGLEELRAQMTEEKRLYDSFSGTENFVIPGISEDSWIVYIRTNGWFKKITASAPILMRAYVERGSDGTYYIKEDSLLTEEEKAAVAAADASETVRKMNTEYRTELAKAIVQDGKLGSLYERLREGAGADASGSGSAAGNAGSNVGIAGAEESTEVLTETESGAEQGETETVAEAVVEVHAGGAETESAVEAESTAESGSAAETETTAAAESTAAETAAAEAAAAGSTAAETETAATETAADTASTAAETTASAT